MIHINAGIKMDKISHRSPSPLCPLSAFFKKRRKKMHLQFRATALHTLLHKHTDMGNMALGVDVVQCSLSRCHMSEARLFFTGAQACEKESLHLTLRKKGYISQKLNVLKPSMLWSSESG